MNKTELAEKIAQETGGNVSEVLDVLDSFFGIVAESLRAGENVSIRDFGTFSVKEAQSKKGFDFNAGKVITIPARKVPFLKFSKAIKAWLNNK